MDEDFKDVLEEPNYKKYYKYIILGCSLLIIIIILIVTFIFLNKKQTKVTNIKKETSTNNELLIEEKKDSKEEMKKIRVDIKGEINTPNVYELDEDKRIIDVINIAGGLTENADTSYLNLSKKLTDEMVIIVYSKDEINEFKKSNIIVEYVEKECECPDNLNDACINSNKKNTKTDTKANIEIKEEETKDSIININTATIEQFQTLTGVGESKAKKIIEYREENGNFESIEDIKNVSGIGDAMYEKIKDNITV